MYEEKVINGKMCYRYSPEENWREMDYNTLLNRYVNTKYDLEKEVKDKNRMIESVKTGLEESMLLIAKIREFED